MGIRAATAIASSRFLASMRKYPPSCSRVSANGPSVTSRLPLRTRTLVAIDVGCNGLAARYCPLELISWASRSEEHTSELQSRLHLVCRLLLEKKKTAPAPAAIADLTCT